MGTGYRMLFVLCNTDYVSLAKLRKHNTNRAETNLAQCEEEATWPLLLILSGKYYVISHQLTMLSTRSGIFRYFKDYDTGKSSCCDSFSLEYY